MSFAVDNKVNCPSNELDCRYLRDNFYSNEIIITKFLVEFCIYFIQKKKRKKQIETMEGREIVHSRANILLNPLLYEI